MGGGEGKQVILTKCFYILTMGSPLVGGWVCAFFSPPYPIFIVFWWFRDAYKN